MLKVQFVSGGGSHVRATVQVSMASWSPGQTGLLDGCMTTDVIVFIPSAHNTV